MDPSSLVMVVVVLIVIGVVMYLVDHYIPMDPPFKLVIRVVIILALCLYLLRVFHII